MFDWILAHEMDNVMQRPHKPVETPFLESSVCRAHIPLLASLSGCRVVFTGFCPVAHVLAGYCVCMPTQKVRAGLMVAFF